MIDLEPYIGKKCLVQFANGNGWIALVANKNGTPDIVLMKDNIVSTPYIVGVVCRSGQGYAFEIEDPSKNKIQIVINMDMVLTISVVTELHQPSLLVMS